jgi:hypothetical protein
MVPGPVVATDAGAVAGSRKVSASHGALASIGLKHSASIQSASLAAAHGRPAASTGQVRSPVQCSVGNTNQDRPIP